MQDAHVREGIGVRAEAVDVGVADGHGDRVRPPVYLDA